MRLRDWDTNLRVRLAAEALMNTMFWMFFPFLTIYFAGEFGKSKAGLLLIFSQVFSVAANLLGGYCADRFGRKRMMVLSAAGQGLSFLVFGIAQSPWLDSPVLGFTCFTLAGVFGSFYWPASQAMVADLVPEKDRSNVFAIFYTSINISVVVGPILGAIFFVKYPFEVLLVSGLIGLLLSFILAKWTRETLPVQMSISAGPVGKWYHALQTQFKDYGVIMRDRTFLLFIIAGILLSQTFMQLDLLFPVYMKEFVQNQTMLSFGDWTFRVDGEQAFGIILSENGLLVALFTVVVTRWMNRFNERNVFMASAILYAISIIMFGQTAWIWGLIFAMMVFTLGELASAGIQQGFVSKLAPEHLRGQYFAAASLRYTIGRTIAPLSIPLTEWIGYDWTFITLCLLSLLSAGFYWMTFRSYDKQKEASA
ncbi:MDR family MFS transporter [Bacillus sp. B-jedd]|uniref:MDR family MFS transporter n=1 Tax=Bacillus sp. B-jedd TaxID=1476857 RepID=UPI0005155C77|nr:MFS transporter [Bacillus sp. B-jedd]CEG25634.1 major facilitator superfamily protein [Bacillus sp. B-jedd]